MDFTGKVECPKTIVKALEYLEKYGYPVELTAAFVPDGWIKIALDETEFLSLFSEGRNLSAVGEVLLRWEVLKE